MVLIRRSLGAAAVVSVLLAGGCATASARQPGRPAPWPLQAAADLASTEQARLSAAEDVLVATCMRSRGHQYQPRPVGPVSETSFNPYGLLTVEQARLHGYGIGEALLAQAGARRDPNEQIRARLSSSALAGWDRDLLGTDDAKRTVRADSGSELIFRTDSCVYQAHLQVVGSDWDRTLLEVKSAAEQVMREVHNDPLMQPAHARWNDCMHEAGLRFTAVTDGRKQAVDRFTPVANDPARYQAALRWEQQVAMSDARCQQAASLWQVVGDRQVAAEKRIPMETARYIERFSQLRSAALARARQILGPSA